MGETIRSLAWPAKQFRAPIVRHEIWLRRRNPVPNSRVRAEDDVIRTDANGRYRWSGYLLGFALGGFFYGILLHQILQWHHLLSAINSMDIRFQVAADGYFHAFMLSLIHI